MRKLILALAVAASFLASATPPVFAAGDLPYWKLDFRRLDSSYEEVDATARKYAFFYWDGKAYCRSPSGWNGPGAYRLGTRFKTHEGWDGGYPWQGPGLPADHEDQAAFIAYKAEYARDFRTASQCDRKVRHAYHRRHVATVLRRKY